MTRRSSRREVAKPEGEDKLKGAFPFARWLRGRNYVQPYDCKEQVQRHCELNELPFDDFWVEFIEAWERVKYDDRGRDTFADAVDKAKDCKFQFPPGVIPPSRLYVEVASIAFHLSEFTNGNPFLLPRDRVKDAIGATEKSTASNIIKWLVRHGVIACVDERYSKKDGIAKKYILGIGLPKTNQEKPRLSKMPQGNECSSMQSTSALDDDDIEF